MPTEPMTQIQVQDSLGTNLANNATGTFESSIGHDIITVTISTHPVGKTGYIITGYVGPADNQRYVYYPDCAINSFTNVKPYVATFATNHV